MGIMLGNLTVEEMQRRSGVEFPSDLIAFMGARHQSEAQNIQPGKWHCFDVPFVLVCGDMETAREIFKHLSPLAPFKNRLHIGLPQGVSSELNPAPNAPIPSPSASSGDTTGPATG
jgi:hypothetical protein